MNVKLAHPYKTRAIAEARIKNDSLDAKMLAHLFKSKLNSRNHMYRQGSESVKKSNENKKSLDGG